MTLRRSVGEPASGPQQPDEGELLNKGIYGKIYGRFASLYLLFLYFLPSIIDFMRSAKATNPSAVISFQKISPCVARMSGWAFS